MCRFSFLRSLVLTLILFLNISYLTTETSSPTQVFATDCINGVCPAPGIFQVQQLMTRLINISVNIAFLALTVWLVWGALKFFITSGGDPKALAHAWASVTWAFMGLFFMVLAWLVLKLIVGVTGANVTAYCLGFPPYCI